MKTAVITTIVLFVLSGCAHMPAGQTGYQPATVNGFDPTLTSHRQALGLD